MTFLNPLVLIGLVAAGIPVLIHLLQLKKLRRVDFSSIRFLKEIQHASAKRVKLRDYLLLLLRTLAIAAIVLAFSRPAVKGFPGSNSKTASFVIVDNSPSTTARNEYGEIASQIRHVSADLIGNLHPGDDASVLLTASAGEAGDIASSLDPRSLSARVTRSEPSNVSGSYGAAIRDGLGALRRSGYANREIYLVGDMQRTEFGNAAKADVPENARIFFIRTEESPNDNLSVSRVKFVNPVVEVSLPSQVEATITNNDGSNKDGVVVGLYIDGKKVAQSVTNVGAGISRTVKLAFSVPSSGYHKGKVKIDDNSIQGDNTFYFAFYAIRRLRVVVVSSMRQKDYVLSAVRAVLDTSSLIDTKITSARNFAYLNMEGTDVIVVESYPVAPGLSAASQGFDAKIERFVEGGGGAILFAPDRGELASFVPLVEALGIGRVKALMNRSASGFAGLEHIDASDDFFAGVFSTEQGADRIKDQLLTKVFVGVEIEASPFTHVLMSTSAGPFLMSRQAGSGYVFAVACGADTSSSNFPLSPFFPIVIQRALFYSASVSRKPLQVYAGGEAVYRYAGGGVRSAALISPSGNRSEVVPEFVGGTARFTFHGLDKPGTYTLVGPDTLNEISVNLDPRESDLTQESDAGIRSFSEKIGFSAANIYIVNAGKNTVADVDRLRRGEDLSFIFAAAALLFLIGEIFVSRMKTIF